MNKQYVLKLGLGLGLAVWAVGASALPITPQFGTFGSFASGIFSGSGIPNSAVAVTTYSGSASSTLTLALSAAQRCDISGPCGAVVINNGAGTFTAQSGAPFASVAPTPLPTYASWNINYYANGNTNLYDFKLFYDFDPASMNDASTHGIGKLFAAGGGSNATDQNSINMGFGYLTTGFPGVVTPPAFTPFNPNVNGEYSFALIAFDKTSGAEVARSAIILSAVPEPEGYVLGLAGLLGLAVTARRRRSAH
jgi:hypothetical protein